MVVGLCSYSANFLKSFQVRLTPLLLPFLHFLSQKILVKEPNLEKKTATKTFGLEVRPSSRLATFRKFLFLHLLASQSSTNETGLGVS